MPPQTDDTGPVSRTSRTSRRTSRRGPTGSPSPAANRSRQGPSRGGRSKAARTTTRPSRRRRGPTSPTPASPRRSRRRAPEPEAILDLKADHARLRSLFPQLAAARDAHTRENLFQDIQDELAIHERLEEEIFYPAFRDAAGPRDRHLYFEAREEHQSVDRLLAEMRRTDFGSEAFAAQCKVLQDQVLHHADEEERILFPKARRVMDAEKLQELAGRMRRRRLELQGQAPVERANHDQEAARDSLWGRLFGPSGDDERAI
jgi:hemerythrin superfamily protein